MNHGRPWGHEIMDPNGSKETVHCCLRILIVLAARRRSEGPSAPPRMTPARGLPCAYQNISSCVGGYEDVGVCQAYLVEAVFWEEPCFQFGIHHLQTLLPGLAKDPLHVLEVEMRVVHEVSDLLRCEVLNDLHLPNASEQVANAVVEYVRSGIQDAW